MALGAGSPARNRFAGQTVSVSECVGMGERVVMAGAAGDPQIGRAVQDVFRAKGP